MANFCKQCSEELFGSDTRDLAREGENRGKLGPDEGWVEICEGCGPILVDDDGVCISADCMENGHKVIP